MYTSGHEIILKRAIDMLDSNIHAYLNGDNMKNLFQGLKYPDFPCGTYKLVPIKKKNTRNSTATNKETKQTEVKLIFERKLCSLFKLFGDLDNVLASAFSSHNGYYSVWHSMTYNPERPVYKISRDILDQIMGFLRLSVYSDFNRDIGDRFFWLGMALHTIMDSYSPAHTLRLQSSTEDPTDLLDAVKTYPADMNNKTLQVNAILKDLKDALMPIAENIDSDDPEMIEQVVKHIAKKHKVKGSKQFHQLRGAAMFLYFFNHHQLKIKSWVATQTPNTKEKASNVLS